MLCHTEGACLRGCPGAMCPGTAREHTSEEEQLVLSHARAALASTRLVTGKSQLRSALPAVKQILAAPLLKQSRRSGAMAGALSHGRLLLAPRVNQPCRRQCERGQCWVPSVVHVQVHGHWCCWCHLGRAGHALPSSRCCAMAWLPVQLHAKCRLFWVAGMAAICLCFPGLCSLYLCQG